MNSPGLVPWKDKPLEARPSTDLSHGRGYPAIRAISITPVQQLVRLLRRHFATIVACTGITTSLFLLWAARQPRLYQASANIAIYREAASISVGKDSAAETADTDEYTVSLETQLQILQSRSIALSVVRQLGLDQNAEFMHDSKSKIEAAARRTPDGKPTAADLQSVAAGALLSSLTVIGIRDTRVVQVSFTGSSPVLDAKIVNALVEQFIQDSIRSRYEASTRSAKFLSEQLTDLRTKVEESEEKLVNYQREHNIVGIDEKQNIIVSKLDDLNKQLTQSEADRIDKESLVQTMAAGSLDEIPETKDSEALQNLRLREAELKNEYAQANTIYGPNYPKVIELQNRIRAAEASIQGELKRLEARAREEYEASLRRERKLQAAFDAQKADANRLNESAIQYGLLKRDVDSNRRLYDGLQERMKEAEVSAGLRSSNIRLIDAAEPPASPVSPNLPRSLYLGLFVGTLVSAAMVAIKEGMDRALRDPADVESFTAMPSLAVIPEHRANKKALPVAREPEREDVICLTQPRSAMAEAFRGLGTSIMLASSELKVLVITSPLPGEGKTTSAVNSAVVIAQQGKRVLLVDSDLRKPTLHHALRLPNERGLSSVLTGEADVEETILRHQWLTNLWVLPAGPAHSMPAEMLGSTRMREIMSLWRSQYDYVIFDTPPVLAVTDAVRLGGEADSALLVLRSGRTTRDTLGRACDILNQARVPVLGIVVNGINFGSPGSYYSGYYPELARTYYKQDIGNS